MKIAFLTRCLNYGGAERQLIALAKGLSRQGHDISVVTFYAGGALEHDLREAHVSIISLGKKSRWNMLGFTWRLIKLVRKQRPDVLHSYLGIPNILSVILKVFVPRLRTAWGVRASNMELDRYDWTARLAYKIERKLSRFADLIIVNSHAGFDYAVEKGFPSEKMIVIPNGIDTQRFCPDRNSGRRLRLAWGVGENELLVGVIARLDPMKDHSTFLKAAALLAKERADVRYICIGDGPDDYRQKLHALGEQLGLTERLVWETGRDDMTAVYNSLDILVSSSSFGEGFSNVIGEAMSCGVLCVATDIGDSARIVGRAGVVVTPADATCIAEGCRQLLALDPLKRAALAMESQERVKNFFSEEKMLQTAEQYLTKQIDTFCCGQAKNDHKIVTDEI